MNFTEYAGEETKNLIDTLITDNAQDDYYLLLAAPTGVGKSHFVKNTLYDYCKKHHYRILYLLPRKVVKDEFIEELQSDDKADVITVREYQEFELLADHPSFLPYNIIICDECHYFVSDSIFNPYTERSFVRIIKYAKHAVKLFITATETPMKEILTYFLSGHNKELLSLKMEDDTLIKHMTLKFLTVDSTKQKESAVKKILEKIDDTEDTTEKDIFNHIPNGEKAIVFCDTAKYAHDLWKKHKNDSLFICSRGNKKNQDYVKDIDEKAYNQMLHEHNFDCKYVFCTSALDVGFSIKDRQVKHIICLLWDWNSIVQAIGRKRIQEDEEGGEQDTFTVYLRDYSKSKIKGLITATKSKFEHYNYLMAHGAQAYFDRYEQYPDPAKIVYYARNAEKQFEPAVNRFVWWYHVNNKRIINEINSMQGNWKYQNWVRQQFKLPLRKDRTAYGIERDLKPLAEEGRIFKGNEGKMELANIIGLRDDRNRLLTTDTKINAELEKMGVHYRIVKGKRQEGKQTYYVIKIGDAII